MRTKKKKLILIYIYIYIYIRGVFNKFPDFFVQTFKIVVDSWKFTMLLLYVLWDDWPVFMISASNEQLQQQLEYTLLKPDCHSWGISKMQFDTLEERYAIKLCFKLGKIPQKLMDCFRLLLEHLAWIECQFLSGIRDSRKAGSLSEVVGTEQQVHCSWRRLFRRGLSIINYTATCLPSRKRYKLDEPDTQDTAGEARTSS